MKRQIVKVLQEMGFRDGDRLPSVRTLMKSLGASSATVQAALAELESNGKICKIQGKGCFWGKAPKTQAIPNTPEKGYEKISRGFNRDFAQGYLKPSQPLPLAKELCTRYNVSPSTLRNFLAEKVEHGVLYKQGRRYFFKNNPHKKVNAPLSELIFVTRCNSWGGFNAESERELDFLRLIYKTAGRDKYKLTLFGFNEASGKLIDRSGKPCKLSEHPNAVGAILSTLLVQDARPLLYFFSGVKIPVAVWWEHPIGDVPKSFLRKDNWMFFNSTFGKQPGKEIGKYLLKQGITEAAYFSPYHGSSWSKDRLTGLEESGLVVHPYVDDEFASPWDYKEIARKKVEKYSVDILTRSLEKDKLKALAKRALEFQEKNGKNMPWICVNDEVVGIFMEMEEENNLNIPEPISGPAFIAFDNSVESYLLRIPSYDFNTEALAEQMFYYIANPQAFDGIKKIHHILGNVVEK
jgi:DNA-binding GntR family transcriptional regulator